MRHQHQRPQARFAFAPLGQKKGSVDRHIIGRIVEPYFVDDVKREREFTFHATKGFRSTRI